MNKWAAVLSTVFTVGAAWGDVAFNGLYHNNTNLDATTEAVPAYAPTTPFLGVDYDQSSVTVHFLTESPASGGSGDAVSNRVRFYSNGENFQDAVLVTNLVIESGTPFHNTPATGAVTVDLYRAVWEPTHGFVGTVYYSPQVRTFFGGSENDQQYLVKTGTGASLFTNSFFWAANAQGIGIEPFNGDYSFAWTNPLPVNYDYFYFNNALAGTPQSEAVPGLGGQNFLQWNYASNQASYAYMLAPPSELIGVSTRFFFTDGPAEMVRAGAYFTNVVIDSGSPFHGLPVSGALTLEVWRTEFWPPSGWSGTVYYAHQIFTKKDASTWMVQGDGSDTITNNWSVGPQFFTTNGPFGRDWSFVPAAKIDRTSFNRDYAYINNAASFDPQVEVIPQAGPTNFVEANYATTTTTFYVMTPHFANLVPNEGVVLQMRISWSSNNLDNYVTEYPGLVFDRNLVITSGSPFHGLPGSGSFTADLWHINWRQPTNSAGQALTNAITVYFAPLLKTTAGSGAYQTDYTYLLKTIGVGPGNGSNNYPIAGQLYGPDNFGNDYSYVNLFSVADADGDGIPDAWEQQYFGTATNGATGDNDTDSYDNLSEYIAGTVPTNGASYFRIINIAPIAGSPQFSFNVAAGRIYTLEQRDSLVDAPDWTPYTAITSSVDGTTTTSNDATNRRNYRIKVKLAAP